MIKKVYTLMLMVLVAALTFSCADDHFLGNKDYRKQVHEDFLKRKDLAAGRQAQLFDVLNDSSVTVKEKEALEFLYAYMPYSDLADYDGEFFLKQVRYAFKTQETFSWGKNIPEDIFRHFVLVYRVNNENLDTSRMAFYHELKDRIKDMSMYDAALEVNHWCHEKVTYQPTDGRTSAPLATVKTSYGRCGEESTFTVTAMRSVGIPARQCYTPRWAHTDDNHAWVEVWVDGKWYYLGACEPDAKLNMGWFSFPSTRTMMVHSNAYGKYNGPEEINHKTELTSRINMLDNYAKTRKITVRVIDENSNPVEDATVKFKLYNYAEYYPLSTNKTDENGLAQVTTGYGDLLVWASKDENYNYKKFDVRTDSITTISLTRTQGTAYVDTFEMVPPNGVYHIIELSQQEKDHNNKRLQYEDSLRNAYVATFPNTLQIHDLQNENLTKEQLVDIVGKSMGNYNEIISFLNDNQYKKEGLYLYDFMKALSDKDLRDVPANVLNEHLVYFTHELQTQYPADVFIKGILPARISNEYIIPWRKYLFDEFLKLSDAKFNPQTLLEWTKNNIKVDTKGNYFGCPISPKGVFELKHSDKHSRDIFYVAACRSLNIPAYIDNATNQIFVYDNNTWKNMAFETENQNKQYGTLVLNSNFNAIYWTHYTIAKFENGDFRTFDFENDDRVANFPATLQLEAGYYMLSTGHRYSDGTTESRLEFFNVKPGEIVTKDIVLLPLTPKQENYGTINLDIKPIKSVNKSLADYFTSDEIILCFVDPSTEPTKHLYNDINLFKNEFESWNGNIVFIVPSSKVTPNFMNVKSSLPANSTFIVDNDSEFMNFILNTTKQVFRENYPLVFIVNKDGNIVFKSEGYRIGTGELLYKSLIHK